RRMEKRSPRQPRQVESSMAGQGSGQARSETENKSITTEATGEHRGKKKKKARAQGSSQARSEKENKSITTEAAEDTEEKRREKKRAKAVAKLDQKQRTRATPKRPQRTKRKKNEKSKGPRQWPSSIRKKEQGNHYRGRRGTQRKKKREKQS